METKEKHRLMFLQLVSMFHAATMQQLGKVKNPITDTIEQDLTGAQGSIEMLDMLKEKTRGNLSEDEERLITDSLRELKLNYVDEFNKRKTEKVDDQNSHPGVHGVGGEETKEET
jgi:hypothetical protein